MSGRLPLLLLCCLAFVGVWRFDGSVQEEARLAQASDVRTESALAMMSRESWQVAHLDRSPVGERVEVAVRTRRRE